MRNFEQVLPNCAKALSSTFGAQTPPLEKCRRCLFADPALANYVIHEIVGVRPRRSSDTSRSEATRARRWQISLGQLMQAL